MINKMPITKEEFITATQIHWKEIIRILNAKHNYAPMAIKSIALRNKSSVIPRHDCFPCQYDSLHDSPECDDCLLTPKPQFCLSGLYGVYLEHILSFKWRKAAKAANEILKLTYNA